jgi:hypothetical protein
MAADPADLPGNGATDSLMRGVAAREPARLHRFKNHLTVILGFCELLLMDLPDGAVKNDILEIQKAASAALADFPELARRYRDE